MPTDQQHRLATDAGAARMIQGHHLGAAIQRMGRVVGTQVGREYRNI